MALVWVFAKSAKFGAFTDGWNGLSVLHTRPRASARRYRCVPGAGYGLRRQDGRRGALDVLFLLGADEIDMAPGAFVVYIGTMAIAARIAPT